MVRLDFPRTFTIVDLFRSSREEADAVLKEWRALLPHAADLVKWRCDTVKRVGARSLGRPDPKGDEPALPVRATPVPGRNDPCPCGSGKKYKKCCGGK